MHVLESGGKGREWLNYPEVRWIVCCVTTAEFAISLADRGEN